jgi:hypothetical protein
MNEKINALFNDYCLTLDESIIIKKELKEMFDKDEDLINLKSKLDIIKEEIDKRKEEIAEDLLLQDKQLKENLKLIVEDVSIDKEVKSSFVKKIFNIQKKIKDKNFDELTTLNETHDKIFE